MIRPRLPRTSPLLLIGLVLVLLFAISGVAQASFGEISRFGAPGLNSKEEGEVGKLTPAIRQFTSFKFRPFHVIGVEPTANDVYVLEEYKLAEEVVVNKQEEIKRFLRLQEFSSAGTLLGHHDFTFTGLGEEGNTASPPPIEGIAVDPAKGRLYFLMTEEREKKPEKEAISAAALYAFKTTPNGSKELEPVSGAPEGVLAGPATLNSLSETPGAALLYPQGITVDPATHEVIILGHTCLEETEKQIKEKACATDELIEEEEDQSGAYHYATQRVKENGELGERIADKTNILNKQTGEGFPGAPASPVVVGSGGTEKLLANDYIEELTEEGPLGGRAIEDFMDQFPATAAGTPSRTKLPDVGGTLGRIENVEVEGDDLGGTMSVSPDGKTLYAVSRIENEETEGKHPSLLGISIRNAETLATIGWTGGKQAGGTDKCVFNPGVFGGEGVQIAAGNGVVFALVPEYLTEPLTGSFPTKEAIIELGEGGSGCPLASSAKIEALFNGKEISEPVAKEAITLSSTIKQGDALSTKWTIENEGTKAKEESTSSTDEFQHPSLKHTFAESGKYKVTEEIKTDNLETPTINLTRTYTVGGSAEAPKITEQPKNAEVSAGGTAVFTAAASGKPAPSVQWLVKKTGGSFENDTSAEGDKGALTGKLEVPTTTGAKNGYEYEAKFTNSSGSITTVAAKLTVVSSAPAVTKQPANASVTEGATATFTATASGAPTPTVQWEQSTDGGSEWNPIPGATSTTLSILGTTKFENGWEYRALFANGVGTPVRTSAATLTVTEAVKTTPTETTPITTTTGETVTTPPPPGGGVLGKKEGSPTATVAGASSLSVSSAGAVTIKVSCPANATCAGTVTLQTASAVAASAHSSKAKKKILTLGSASFSLTGGQAKTITVHLSAAARKLLAHSHTLAAKATVASHNPAGEKQTTTKTLSLHLAKKKK